jgi:hypothetical protein
MMAGVLYDTLYPYITTAPLMNIHFVEPLVLESVLTDPDYGLSAGGAKAKQLLEMRESRELTEEDVTNVLGIGKADRLYYYFGTITWFQEINIAKGRTVCNIIVCRYPPRDAADAQKPEWYIVEKKWN